MYLKLKYGDFLLIDIVYENGPINFFCISAVLMLDVSIDTGLTTKKTFSTFNILLKSERRSAESLLKSIIIIMEINMKRCKTTKLPPKINTKVEQKIISR